MSNKIWVDAFADSTKEQRVEKKLWCTSALPGRLCYLPEDVPKISAICNLLLMPTPRAGFLEGDWS